MSTLQHIAQPVRRPRVILAVLVAGAALALTIALIAASGGSAPSLPGGGIAHPTASALQSQLQAVNGPRYGLSHPTARPSAKTSPQQQLQAVAGARYRVRAVRH
jgi:hypothetical protein